MIQLGDIFLIEYPNIIFFDNIFSINLKRIYQEVSVYTMIYHTDSRKFNLYHIDRYKTDTVLEDVFNIEKYNHYNLFNSNLKQEQLTCLNKQAKTKEEFKLITEQFVSNLIFQ